MKTIQQLYMEKQSVNPSRAAVTEISKILLGRMRQLRTGMGVASTGIGAGVGAITAGEDNRLGGALAGGLLGHVGGRLGAKDSIRSIRARGMNSPIERALYGIDDMKGLGSKLTVRSPAYGSLAGGVAGGLGSRLLPSSE